MTIDWSGCLICDLLHATEIAYHEAHSDWIAAQRLRRFKLRGLNLSHVNEAEQRAESISNDLVTLKRHPCKRSYRLQG